MGKNHTQNRPKERSKSSDKGKQLLGLVVSRAGKSFIVENLEGSNQGQRHRARARRELTLLVGDRVQWEKTQFDQGWITQIETRTNVIERFTGAYSTKQMAANVSALAIVFAPRPAPSAHLLNQYLVAAQVFECKPILILNKTDLLDGPQTEASALLARYQHLGFEGYAISAKAKQGMRELASALASHTSILLGQSGVGKSSLVRAWLPESEIIVGEINEQNSLGRHTTSNSTLYHLPAGGMLIDAPGIRDFKLSGKHPPQTVAKAFPDIDPLLNHCKFRNCAHDHEPGCALKLAISQGTLDASRLDEFKQITTSFVQHTLQ